MVDGTDHTHEHDPNGKHPASACTTHFNKAFEQYKAHLDTARCICRSVLERGLPSTHCSEQYKSTAPKEGPSGAHAHKAKKPHHHHHHIPGLTRRHRKHPGHVHAHGHDHKHNHDLNEIQKVQDDGSSCCSGRDNIANPAFEKMPKTVVMGDREERDLEKAAGLEQISLVVDGMTCSGCGNKMERTLKAISGVSGVRVNFVMGNAEFDYDHAYGNVDEMLKGVERATNFKCTRLASGDQAIDVLASGDSAKALTELTLPGATGVTITSKKAVRISYDPLTIGARNLLESIGHLSSGLAPPEADPSMSSGRKHFYDMSLKTFVAALFTIPVAALAWGDTLVSEHTRAIVSLILGTVVQIIAVPVFYKPAISTLISDKSLEMDMLVTISITAAYLYSIIAFSFRMAGKPLETGEFFETSTLLITLVLLGRVVAAYARVRAVAAVSLRSLQCTMAILIEKDTEREIDARLLQYGDRFRVEPHSRVVTDGRVLKGSSEVDESMLTGESMPVVKEPGNDLIAGTVNGPGVLEVQLTRLPGKNTVTDIAELVEEAANSKPRIQDVADKVASWFVPVVTTCALITTIVWIVVGLKVRNESAGESVANAITYAVAVLAVSCPCALGLAVPMVLVVAGGIAARGGTIIKSAQCTASSYKVTDVVFDKTGTLTESDLDVIDEKYFSTNREEAIAIAKALVAGNNHPVSVSVAKYLEQHKIPVASVGDVQSVPGAGVEATKGNTVLRAGNPHWTNNESHEAVASLLKDGMSTLLVTKDNTPIASFGLRTRVRPQAAAVIAKLHARNIKTHLVSGDQVHAVQLVASMVGIDSANIAARRTPAQKRDYVAALMGDRKYVMFCGDGTNDAVAVAQADVGVQIGGSLSSSDVTRGVADVILLMGLDGIPFLLDVSRAAFNRMVFNFVWSAIYNVFAILLAAGAFVKVRIPPAYAGLGEIVSVLPVIAAAMTMLLKKQGK